MTRVQDRMSLPRGRIGRIPEFEEINVHDHRRVLRHWGAGLAAFALLLVGCAEDEPAPEPASDTPDDAEAADDSVEVVMRDFAFENLPDRVPAGTRFTVVNEAERELHELVAFRLADDEERSVEDLAELSPGELVGALGEPAAVLLAEPDGPVIPAVGDGTLAEPGRYAILCFIPTGVDPAEYLDAAAESEEGPPEIEGAGPPHFVHGMLGEVTVE